MNNKILKEKFLKGKDDTFSLVDYNLPVDVYVGYYNHLPTLVIEGNNKIHQPMSTANIYIMQYEKDDSDKYQLCFSLQYNDYFDVFVNFCLDIIDVAKDCNDNNVITKSYKRWMIWRDLFTKKMNSYLSIEEVQGLIGELLFINCSVNESQLINVIDSWGGGDYQKKDFEFDDTWTEVKTVISGKNTIKISSKEQLRSEQIGCLTVYTLERTNANGDFVVSLNKLVDIVSNRIIDATILDIFIKKLRAIGYVKNDYYDEFKYSLIERNDYIVNGDFPKIVPDNLMQGIVKVNYEIDLAMIEKFKKE